MVLLFALLAEVVLLLALEKKVWGTLYTPFAFLSVPYVLVLVLTVMVAGHFDLVDFYFPSLLPWLAGLPVFALAGHVVRFAGNRWFCEGNAEKKAEEANREDMKKRFLLSAESEMPAFWLGVLSLLVVLPLSARVGMMLVSPQDGCGIGTDCFGFAFAGRGFWGHLLVSGMALEVFMLSRLPRPFAGWNAGRMLNAAFAGLFLMLLFLLLVYQVKSWVMLPLLAGFLVPLLAYRRLKLSHVVGVLIAGTGFFFLSYIVLYFAGDSLFPEANTFGMQLKEISGLFLHYLTSGTLGLSLDMQQGIVEQMNNQYILTPFYNIWNFFAGQPAVSGYSPEFIHTGLNYTNIRTFFGSVFVYMGWGGLLSYAFVFGLMVYVFFGIWRCRRTWLSACLYAWWLAVLLVAWFDIYTQLLNTWEIPFWLLVFGLLHPLWLRIKTYFCLRSGRGAARRY